MISFATTGAHPANNTNMNRVTTAIICYQRTTAVALKYQEKKYIRVFFQSTHAASSFCARANSTHHTIENRCVTINGFAVIVGNCLQANKVKIVDNTIPFKNIYVVLKNMCI
jgi:hypothetical protein